MKSEQLNYNVIKGLTTSVRLPVSHYIRCVLGLAQPPVQCILGALFPGVKRPEPVADIFL